MSCSRPTKFAHVVYRTRRFNEMLAWYQTVFGARVQHQNPVMAFMTYDDEHHRFADLDAVVRHYEKVRKFNLSDQERNDLVEYLKSL